ncbi:MAG: sigma 54-interacting transcriptional regulator [Deltaproteobacteria bacterium]|nr:sigma 54-interacting transcriptional regulator [Deltaproteobacteria bacterium]
MSDPKRSPATEVITASTGGALRRMRKVRITIVQSPTREDIDKSFTFARDELRIGSSPDGDVVVNDPSVSREHLAVRVGPHGWALWDLGSTNGTFIGELRVERVAVSDEVLVRVGKSALRVEPLAETVEQEISPRARFGRMLGSSAAMREVFAVLERIAATDLTVLVEGETGTGKELAAEGLHEASGRAGAFVAVNCGAIPRELIESELFGHVKGAFSGAVRERTGAFLSADKGTLFLDEVGELPLDMQAKLLRALERREVKPVGSDRALPLDCRIVAATNRVLAKEVTSGRFRQDLFYRLAVVVVRIPPLRTRLEDLRMLVDHIQDEMARRRTAAGLAPWARLDEASIAMLMRHDFPGNVRELRNVVERWAVLGSGQPLAAEATDAATQQGPTAAASDPGAVDGTLLTLPYHEAKDAWVERFDRTYVEEILKRSGGNVSKAARDAGVDRRHLQRLMARFGVRATSD